MGVSGALLSLKLVGSHLTLSSDLSGPAGQDEQLGTGHCAHQWSIYSMSAGSRAILSPATLVEESLEHNEGASGALLPLKRHLCTHKGLMVCTTLQPSTYHHREVPSDERKEGRAASDHA